MKNIFRKKKDINYNDLSVDLIKQELYKEKHKNIFSNLLKNTLFILLTIVAVASIITTLFMPIIEITDSAMKPILNDEETVLTIKTKHIKPKDIIAFYYGNKILIKRVIAVQGDWVNIDVDGNVYVNGNKIEESYVTKPLKGDVSIEFPIQVQNESYFVLSDERENMNDSRINEIGCIKEENIIGKVVLRIWPFNKIKFI